MGVRSDTVSAALMEDIKSQMKRPGELKGYSWGVPRMDRATKGIYKGMFVIVGADTSAGKSWWLGLLVLRVARQLKAEGFGRVLRVIHCEMVLTEFQGRLIAAMTGISKDAMDEGRLTSEEFARVHEAAIELADLPIEYLENPNSIAESVDFITGDGRCAFFAVDHLQAHNVGVGNLTPLDTQGAALLAKSFYEVARNVCPGVALSQLTKEFSKRDDKRPTKSDLFGGMMTQAFASVIIMLYVPAMYEGGNLGEAHTMWTFVEKNRHGKTVDIKFIRDPNTMRIEEAA